MYPELQSLKASITGFPYQLERKDDSGSLSVTTLSVVFFWVSLMHFLAFSNHDFLEAED